MNEETMETLRGKLSPGDYAKVLRALGETEGADGSDRSDRSDRSDGSDRIPWVGCQRCPLFGMRGGLAPWVIGEPPRVLVVEYVPDLLLGGPTAEPWRRSLAEALGGNVYLTAWIKCPQAEVSPIAAYQERCAHWWEGEFLAVAPPVVVTLGEEALTALTGQVGLEGVRARRDPLDHRGVPVVATFGAEDLRADTRVGRWGDEWQKDLAAAARLAERK